jgi:hypothetical protein
MRIALVFDIGDESASVIERIKSMLATNYSANNFEEFVTPKMAVQQVQIVAVVERQPAQPEPEVEQPAEKLGEPISEVPAPVVPVEAPKPKAETKPAKPAKVPKVKAAKKVKDGKFAFAIGAKVKIISHRRQKDIIGKLAEVVIGRMALGKPIYAVKMVRGGEIKTNIGEKSLEAAE